MLFRMTPIALAVSMLTLTQGSWAQTSPDQKPESASSQATTLPEVKVTATAERAEDLPPAYAGGQVAKGARLGLLGNQSIIDTPFNITSYTSKLIEDQQAKTVADVLNNDPSVRFTTSGAHAYENFRIRGFDVHGSDLAINGMFGLAPIGSTSLEYVERVEVLKGPSAMFTGMAPSGGIGGVVNLVPKRAGDDPLTRVTVGYETKNQFSTGLDLGRRFGENKEFGARVNASISDGEAALDGQDKRREFLSAALDYRGQALTASLDVYDTRQKFDGGSPAMYGFATTNIPKAPDPSTNFLKGAAGTMDSKAVIARAEYAFNDDFSVFGGIGTRKHDYSGWINGTHAHNVMPDGSARVRGVAQLGYDDSVSSEVGARTKFNTGGVAHELVLQGSRLEMESGYLSNVTGMLASDIYDPASPVIPATPSGRVPKTTDSTMSSLALVDTMSMLQDKLRLTLGLRQQQVKQSSYNATGATTAKYDESAVTPAVGVVVKPWGEGVSLYASYVEGLSKGDSVTVVGGYAEDKTFKPYKTEQTELGVKWNAGTFTNTVAMFQISKPTLITSGTAPNRTASDDGESQMTGLEWNTFGELSKTVRVLGGVSYTKAELTKAADGVNQGNQLFGVPRWQANLGAEWDTPLTGLSLSGRVIANSSQYLDNANTYEIPGWAQVDAGARYETKVSGRKTIFRLNINNLFDRHYWSGSFAEPRATLGLGRTVRASVSMDF